MSNPPSTEPTSELGASIRKPTNDRTSGPKSDALSKPSEPMRGYSIGHISLGDIERYQKVSDHPGFTILEEHIKDPPWGYTWKIQDLGQEENLKAGEYLLILTKRPLQLSTNL